MQVWVERLNQFSDISGRALSWLTLLMVLITFVVVVLRYGFDLGWIAMQESIMYLHAWVFTLGAAYTLRHDGHVRVDVFYQKLSPRGKAWVDLLGCLLLLTPMCVFMAWVSWQYVVDAWAVYEGSPEAGGLPWVYLLKTSLVLMPALIILQGLAQALTSWLCIKDGHA